jgi:hypothetical protein
MVAITSSTLAKIALFFKESIIRFAIAIIRDRVSTDLKRMGYVRDNDATWTIVREDASEIGGSKISASVTEANCIREFVNSALGTLYKEKFDEHCISRR